MNFAFKLVSLNGREIRSFEKRKAVFGWLMKQEGAFVFCKKGIVPKK